MYNLSFILATLLALASPQPRSIITVQAPKATLRLEIANTEPEREQGLMNRTHLAPHTGMLFVFSVDQPVDFWMKNTLISLDMVFVGPDGRVREVTANVPTIPASLPDDQIPLEPGTAKYVIELPAGEAAGDGIL